MFIVCVYIAYSRFVYSRTEYIRLQILINRNCILAWIRLIRYGMKCILINYKIIILYSYAKYFKISFVDLWYWRNCIFIYRPVDVIICTVCVWDILVSSLFYHTCRVIWVVYIFSEDNIRDIVHTSECVIANWIKYILINCLQCVISIIVICNRRHRDIIFICI